MDIKAIRLANMRALADEAGGRSALAKKLDIAYAQVNHYIGKNPIRGIGDVMARKAEEAFGKPFGWMDHIHEEGTTAAHHPTPPVLIGLEPWADGDPLSADEVDLPYFEDVAFAAGDGSFLSQVGDHAGRNLRFLRETLRSAGVDIAHAACAKNSGNSMEDLIRDGATIGIDISKAELPIRDGKIYAMFHGGILRVKYLHRLPGGGVRLRSHNRDEYPDEDLSREQLADFRVLGWVFWWSTVDRW